MDVADTNEATTRRCYQRLWNDRDRSVIPEWISPDYIGHFSRYPDPILGVPGFETMADELFTAFPDLRVRIDDLVAAGDRVASHVRIVRTHRGPLQGYAPTGVRVDTTFAAIERYVDGRCVEEWVFSDDLGSGARALTWSDARTRGCDERSVKRCSASRSEGARSRYGSAGETDHRRPGTPPRAPGAGMRTAGTRARR